MLINIFLSFVVLGLYLIDKQLVKLLRSEVKKLKEEHKVVIRLKEENKKLKNKLYLLRLYNN